MSSILIRNGTIITMNPSREILEGNILIKDDTIVDISQQEQPADIIIDANDKLVTPGLIQIHVHLNQTLFRGIANDLDTIEWLREWIWPLEQSHTPQSIYASARLSIAEMIRSGTTTALTMESMNHTENSFIAAQEMGFRAIIGNAMMDLWEPGTGIIGETTNQAIEKSLDLLEKYHNTANERLKFAFCPRGTRNVTDDLWKEAVHLADKYNVMLHTHAAENENQSKMLAEKFGDRDIDYLEKMGALSDKLIIAHGIWFTAEERKRIAKNGVSIAHCPGSNLKLASGFAKIPEMLSEGINIAIGADGAPCNNNLDAFNEMRLAALIHKPRCGPKSMSADQILEMATLGGAKALHMHHQIGSIEVGKKADIILINRNKLHAWPMISDNPVGKIVYEHRADDVSDVIIDGRLLLKDGCFTCWNHDEILSDAENALKNLLHKN